jgi:hypothetical protein
MKSVPVILFLIFAFLGSAFSQGEIDTQSKILYRNERTFALTLNTNGYSGDFRYAKRFNEFKKTLYVVEFAYVKDDKEVKVTSTSAQQISGSYVFGKLNAFYTLRLGIGFQKELFQKQDKGGISIRYFYHFGPVIGFLKPIYYEVQTDSGQTIKVKFEQHLLNIQRKAPFYEGLDELSVVPGVYGKFGFSFEFGKNDKVFNAIETGITADAFIQRIHIMANNNSHWLLFSFYLTYRFGKVLDVEYKHKVNKLDQMLAK